MNRLTLLSLVVASAALCGVTGCDRADAPKSVTELPRVPDPAVDGALIAARPTVDLSILDDQTLIQKARTDAARPAPAPAAPVTPAAPATQSTTSPSTGPASAPATEPTTVPAPDATTAPAPATPEPVAPPS